MQIRIRKNVSLLLSQSGIFIWQIHIYSKRFCSMNDAIIHASKALPFWVATNREQSCEWIDRYWTTENIARSKNSFQMNLQVERNWKLFRWYSVYFLFLLDGDVNVYLSTYTINHSINRERKKGRRDECDIPYR